MLSFFADQEEAVEKVPSAAFGFIPRHSTYRKYASFLGILPALHLEPFEQPPALGRFFDRLLEDVFEEDASEKDLSIDRVIPDRIVRVCLGHRSAFQDMRLEDEINNDRLLSQLPWIEELDPCSDRHHMFV